MTPPPGTARGALLVLSHVCNELDARAEARLLALASTAAAVLWVEPGTHDVARRLQALRERLKDTFDIIAPCTHAAACPLLAKGHERDWCHQFATPPPWAFTDGHWVRFARRAGVDLRSLPYACLVIQARSQAIPPWRHSRSARVLGRPRHHKRGTVWDECSSDGTIRQAAAGTPTK